ncbi:MAG: DUF924 family protein [Pleurocapsa sp.]
MEKFYLSSEVLNFWFSEEVKSLWFKKSIDFDSKIKRLFLETYQLAKAGKLDSWQELADSALALIILLDQFPRNMFRHSPQAFATDAQAVRVTEFAISNNYQQSLSTDRQVFLYMPLMHSENKANQAQCVDLFEKLGKEDNLKFAIKHKKIIDRFGRFPHRNQILGRESSIAEKEFLTQPGSSF